MFAAGDSYLSPEERAERAQRKREEVIARNLTPDWFLDQDSLCLPPRLRVAVIGAGFAGLSAAWYLNACKTDTVLYDAAASIGGRVRTSRSFASAKVIEDGAELVGENHPLLGLHILRFRIKLDELTDDEAAGLTVRTRFAGKDLSKSQKQAMEAKLLKHFATVGAAASVIDEVSPWRSPNAGAADAISVASLLDQLIGKGPSLERNWFNFTLANDNCAVIEKQSGLSLLASVSAARMGSDAAGMMGYWFSTETHRCRGGNDQVGAGLGAQLKDLRLRHVVQQIRIEPGFVPPVRIISTQYDAAGQSLGKRLDQVDYVILATPPTVWSGIDIQPAFDPLGRTMQHGPAIKFMSRYDSRFWEASRLAPTTKWDELGSVWEGTDNQGLKAPFVLTVFSGGPYVLPAAAYPTRLAALYPPGKPPEGVPTCQQFIDWPNEAYIKTGYAIPGIGQMTTVAPNQVSPYMGRMFFAGEQTSPGFFGYMEGALQTGARAARDIIKSVAVPCRYAQRYQGEGGHSSGGGSSD